MIGVIKISKIKWLRYVERRDEKRKAEEDIIEACNWKSERNGNQDFEKKKAQCRKMGRICNARKRSKNSIDNLWWIGSKYKYFQNFTTKMWEYELSCLYLLQKIISSFWLKIYIFVNYELVFLLEASGRLLSKLNIEHMKKLAKYYVWNLEIYDLKNWTLIKLEQKYLESFGMQCRCRMEKTKGRLWIISCVEKPIGLGIFWEEIALFMMDRCRKWKE